MPNRQAQHHRFLILLDRHKARIRSQLIKAKNNYIVAVHRQFDKSGDINGLNLLGAHRRAVSLILQNAYDFAIKEFSRDGLSAIKSIRVEHKAIENYVEKLIMDYTLRYGLQRATTISNTIYDDIMNTLLAGQAGGLGVREIARNILKVQNLSPFRAEAIARTEIHGAATFGSIQTVRQAEKEYGLSMKKAWLPTLDERTRIDHRAMGNEPAIPLDDKFNVGGEMLDRPGDASGSAENVINCRCALIYQEA